MSQTKAKRPVPRAPLTKRGTRPRRSRLLSAAAEHDAANIDALFQAFATNLARRLVRNDAAATQSKQGDE